MGAGGAERAGESERPAESARPFEAARPSPTPTTPPPATPTAPTPPPAAPPTAPATRDAEAAFEAPPTREFEAFSAGAGLAPSLKDTRPSAVAAEEGGAGGEVGARVAGQDARPETGQESRAEAAAADGAGRVARVREHTRARVGRMREEALVVLEEPPDDSGMSFVVLAVLAFLLFVVVLFLSTTVLR